MDKEIINEKVKMWVVMRILKTFANQSTITKNTYRSIHRELLAVLRCIIIENCWQINSRRDYKVAINFLSYHQYTMFKAL